ncbi:Lrp/AsnC family transcriptional regulator [Candidatus Bathyarchaeota archaeon]|nr:Lrp/AsnC family transcriptional regulator [Candidatus Bathyarchaeota archaeon]
MNTNVKLKCQENEKLEVELTRRSIKLLKTLYEEGVPSTTYTLKLKQNELAKKMGISRQALNIHLRRLRELGYIRTGRGFIDVTDKGLKALGISIAPAFIFIKVSPTKRNEAYEKIRKLKIQRAFRVAGDVDAILTVEEENLDEALKELSTIEGIQETKSYVAIETIR